MTNTNCFIHTVKYNIILYIFLNYLTRSRASFMKESANAMVLYYIKRPGLTGFLLHKQYKKFYPLQFYFVYLLSVLLYIFISGEILRTILFRFRLNRLMPELCIHHFSFIKIHTNNGIH